MKYFLSYCIFLLIHWLIQIKEKTSRKNKQMVSLQICMNEYLYFQTVLLKH